MDSQSCVAIIGAIAAAQVAMVGALGGLYLKMRSTDQVVRSNAQHLELGRPGERAPGGGGPV